VLYHFIGIGGIGMSGLARILLEKGEKVQGSDIAPSTVTAELEKKGAKVFFGHSPSYISPNITVVYSSDIQGSNPEYLEAKKLGLPIFHRSAFLHLLMKGSIPLLVAGSHGKTTTSSLLTHILASAGLQPSYSVGGIVRSLGAQAGFGTGDFFVSEADESDGSFLTYSPRGAIVTNIGNDHLSYWQTEEKLVRGFLDFYGNVARKDLFFWCRDDEKLSSLSLKGVSYGFSEGADVRIMKAEYLGWKTRFAFTSEGRLYENVESPLVGRHNVLNAVAVIAFCLKIGVEASKIFAGLETFSGAGRRCEKKGEAGGITVYDDYGHHPTEIYTTLKGIAVAAQGRRLVTVFQPHRFTRVASCFEDFGPSFAPADLVVLTDIYGAGEKPIEGITGKALYENIVAQGIKNCVYVPGEQITEKILSLLKSGDVVVTMGAGDITKMGPKLLTELSK